MACNEPTNVPPIGTAPPTDRHQGGGFVRMMTFTDSSCTSSTWFSDVNANGHGITGLCTINCIPVKNFLTTPLQVDVDAYGHAITDVGKLYIGNRWDDGSGAPLQVRGSVNVTGGNYLLNGQPLEGFVEKDILAGNNITVVPSGPPDDPKITINAVAAGASGQIQYNNSGSFGAGTGLTWDGSAFKVIGRVGIATTTTAAPNSQLEVSGVIRTISDAGFPSGPTAGPGLELWYSIDSAIGAIYAINRTTQNAVPLWVEGLPLVINSQFNGNVGIRQQDPQFPLDVGGDVNITGKLFVARLSAVGLPTSATGLSPGDVWNNGGVLNIV